MWLGTGGGGTTSNLPWTRGFVKYLRVLVACLRMRPDIMANGFIWCEYKSLRTVL